MGKDWNSISSFLARYLGLNEATSDPRLYAMSMANWIIATEPELEEAVLQVLLEGE